MGALPAAVWSRCPRPEVPCSMELEWRKTSVWNTPKFSEGANLEHFINKLGAVCKMLRPFRRSVCQAISGSCMASLRSAHLARPPIRLEPHRPRHLRRKFPLCSYAGMVRWRSMVQSSPFLSATLAGPRRHSQKQAGRRPPRKHRTSKGRGAGGVPWGTWTAQAPCRAAQLCRTDTKGRAGGREAMLAGSAPFILHASCPRTA